MFLFGSRGPSKELLEVIARIERMNPKWEVTGRGVGNPMFPPEITLKYKSADNVFIELNTTVRSSQAPSSSILIEQRYNDGRASVTIYNTRLYTVLKSKDKNEEYLRRYIQKVSHPVFKARVEADNARWEAIKKEQEASERITKSNEQEIRDKFWTG
jgi:hypothetical protein